MNGVAHDVKVYYWLERTLQVDRDKNLRTLFLSDTCRWLTKEEDAGVVGEVITHDHRL